MLREERLCSECIHGTISYIIATVTKVTTEGLGETKYVIDITPPLHHHIFLLVFIKIFFQDFFSKIFFDGSGTKTEFYNYNLSSHVFAQRKENLG